MLPDEVLKTSLAVHRDTRLVEERLDGDPVSAKEDCVPVERSCIYRYIYL